MNLRPIFTRIKQLFKKAPKSEKQQEQHFTMKAPEPIDIPMIGKKRSELSRTSGAARRRARAAKAKRQIKKAHNRQKRQG